MNELKTVTGQVITQPRCMTMTVDDEAVKVQHIVLCRSADDDTSDAIGIFVPMADEEERMKLGSYVTITYRVTEHGRMAQRDGPEADALGTTNKMNRNNP